MDLGLILSNEGVPLVSSDEKKRVEQKGTAFDILGLCSNP